MRAVQAGACGPGSAADAIGGSIAQTTTRHCSVAFRAQSVSQGPSCQKTRSYIARALRSCGLLDCVVAVSFDLVVAAGGGGDVPTRRASWYHSSSDECHRRVLRSIGQPRATRVRAHSR